MVTNQDNDSVTITVGVISGPTTEDGGTATFGITLSQAATAPVTIALSSNDPGEGTVPATIVIPTGNTVATVTVTGIR